MVTRAPYDAGGFEPALEMLERRAAARLLATGVQGIDHLVGGLEPGLMYLFYGTERGGLPDRLLHHLLIEAVRDGGGGRSTYSAETTAAPGPPSTWSSSSASPSVPA